MAAWRDAVLFNRERHEQQLAARGYRPGARNQKQVAAPQFSQGGPSAEQRVALLAPAIKARLDMERWGIHVPLTAQERGLCRSAQMSEAQYCALVVAARSFQERS